MESKKNEFWVGGMFIILLHHCLFQYCSTVFIGQKKSRECPGELQTALWTSKYFS